MARDQTRMAFMSDADEKIDPVSGNDVPPGSLPEEVRDDIDAKLSEGEYVVPADVVRFFGVKFFEDLRKKAKMGLASMEEDGRIGGEPIMEDEFNDNEVVTDEDLEELKGMLSSGMANGGLIDKIVNAAKTDPTVNKALTSQGVTVGMSKGGAVKRYALGGYEDGKTNEAVKGILELVKKNPPLQRMLATKGIQINTTGADKTAEQMKKANMSSATTEPIVKKKPTTVAMAEGGIVKTSKPLEQKVMAAGSEGGEYSDGELKEVIATLDVIPRYKGIYKEAIKYKADEGTLVQRPVPVFDFNDWSTIGFNPGSSLFNFMQDNTNKVKMIKYMNADGRFIQLAEGVIPPVGYKLYTAPKSQATAVPTKIDNDRDDPEIPQAAQAKVDPIDVMEFETPEELVAHMESVKLSNKIGLGISSLFLGPLGGAMASVGIREEGIKAGIAAQEMLKSMDPGDKGYKKLQALVEGGKVAQKGPLGAIANFAASASTKNKATELGTKLTGVGGIYGKGTEEIDGLFEAFFGIEYGAYLDKRGTAGTTGYTGSGVDNIAVGKISKGGNDSGVVANPLTGKVIKVNELIGLENTQGNLGRSTVFREANGDYYTKDFFGRKTKLDYTGTAPDLSTSRGKGPLVTQKPDVVKKPVVEAAPITTMALSSPSSNDNEDPGYTSDVSGTVYDDPYDELEADYDYDPKDPFGEKDEEETDYSFGSAYEYNKGGLLKKPNTSYDKGGYVTNKKPAKTKKKKRKGLGTRP
tara:strand:+ start:4130 stop:6382 length:2253 start_codon:yes stop_codon:yes gene_type:complete